MRRFLRRWWSLATAPVGFVVGMSLGRIGVPTWLILTVVFVLTAGLAFYFRWRDQRWFERQVDQVEQALKEQS